MTRTVKTAAEFPNLNLSVIETVFSTAGEVIESQLVSPIQINSPVRTFTFKGGKMIEFPDTDQESFTFFSPSRVGPGLLMAGKTHFKVTILQDDTRDYCVQTLTKNYSTDASITDINAGDFLNITKGCLIYVHGTSYKLNDIDCIESELFALENNDVKLVATDSCKVYIFRSILKD